MSYTEKVSLSGTALSMILYECSNSLGQEGFLLGDISSEITNHISDSQSDNSRLETELNIKNVLPLPTIGEFYTPAGKIKEDCIIEYLGDSVINVVGWYKFRKNNSVKPTIRDKIITRGLQKYFETQFDKKFFVCCNVACKESSSRSTHYFVYKFGKFNIFDAYEHVEDVSPNLGEKTAGYRRDHCRSSQGIFQNIIKESKIANQTDAILRIHEAVDKRLKVEAKNACETENTVREIENEIKEMALLVQEHNRNKLIEALKQLDDEYYLQRERNMVAELAKAVVEAKNKCFDYNDYLSGNKTNSDEDESMDSDEDKKELRKIKEGSPILNGAAVAPAMNYSAVLKKPLRLQRPENDLIDFSVDTPLPSRTTTINKFISGGDSSPEY